MTDHPRLSDALFNGFVDGRLPARGDREVAIALEADHAASTRAAAWRRQSEALRTAFAPIADEPLPLSLIIKVRASLPERRWGRGALIAGAAFVLGLGTGLALAMLLLS